MGLKKEEIERGSGNVKVATVSEEGGEKKEELRRDIELHGKEKEKMLI